MNQSAHTKEGRKKFDCFQYNVYLLKMKINENFDYKGFSHIEKRF